MGGGSSKSEVGGKYAAERLGVGSRPVGAKAGAAVSPKNSINHTMLLGKASARSTIQESPHSAIIESSLKPGGDSDFDLNCDEGGGMDDTFIYSDCSLATSQLSMDGNMGSLELQPAPPGVCCGLHSFLLRILDRGFLRNQIS